MVSGLPKPAPSGQPETFTVTGLDEAMTYFFAISAFDDQDNSFGVSNCVEAYCTIGEICRSLSSVLTEEGDQA